MSSEKQNFQGVNVEAGVPSEDDNNIGSEGVLEKQEEPSATRTSLETAELDYSIYNAREKWLIVCLVAVAGLFR